MLGLPNPYILGALAFLWLGSVVGAALWYGGVRDDHWAAATERLKAEAATILAQAQKAAADKEAAAATLADKVETDHVEAEKRLAADYAARLDGKRLRDQAGRGASCPNPASPASNAAGDSPQPAATGGCELSQQASDGLKRIALEADAFRLYGLACHDWAMSLGR